MNNLGVAYEHGFGVERDYRAAANWYRSSALKGNAQAQNNLGELYYYGRGFDRDLEQAYAWFKLSASRGNTFGRVSLDNLQHFSTITSNEVAEAEQKLVEIQKQIPAK